MTQRIPSGVGWLVADVTRSSDKWLATLAEPHHPSLGGVGPGIGDTPEESLASLSSAVREASTTRRSRTSSWAPSPSSLAVATAARAVRWLVHLNGDAIENAAAAVEQDLRARRHREAIATDVETLVARRRDA